MTRARRALPGTGIAGALLPDHDYRPGPGQTGIVPGCAVLLRDVEGMDLAADLARDEHSLYAFGTEADFRRGAYRSAVGRQWASTVQVYRADGEVVGIYACPREALAHALRMAGVSARGLHKGRGAGERDGEAA